MVIDTFDEVEEAEPIRRLNKDLLAAARSLGRNEVRYIVDGYYALQEYRKASRNQIRASSASGEPVDLLIWLADQTEHIEGQIKRAMAAWAEEQRPARWMMDQKGIGPVLASALLAHLDITRAPYVGHFWSFAGLNPDVTWNKGERRPWNQALKTLCWRVGDSFVKQSGRQDAYYGQAYRKRKDFELIRNERGDQKELAEKTVDSGRRLTDNMKIYYNQGKLPPGRVDMMARRWTVKLFLAHLHHVMYESEFNTPPPMPYVIDRLGHDSYLGPPNWPRP